MPLIVQPLSEDAFDGFQEEWNQLLSRSPSDTVFLRWEWIHTWWSVFKGTRLLWVLTVREEGRLVGIAPFYINRAGRLGIRQLRLCSDELGPDYLDIMTEKGLETDVAQALWAYLTEHSTLWDVIAFDDIRADSPLLVTSSLFKNYRRVAQPSHGCRFITLQGSFDNYFASRPQLSRFSLKKKEKALLERMNVTHYRLRDASELGRGLNDLFGLHQKRAQVRNLETNFSSDKVKRFHFEVGRLFLQSQIIDLQFLYQGDRPVCAHYYFNYRGRIYFYQSGFDPEWSKWSVSMVLLRISLERAFQEGIQEFDFLKGDEGYKSLWANDIREENALTVYNHTVRGSFLHAGRYLKSIGRQLKHSFNDKPVKAAPLLIDHHPTPQAVPEN